MIRRSRAGLLLRSLLILVSLIHVRVAWSQGEADPASAAVDERDRSVMARFLAVVEKAPRRGTALDRVYGYHVERGTLDTFLKTYQDRTAADPADGVAWMILGLVESQRGRDAAAVAALRKAESARPDDPMPAYYLGQSLVLVGQPDDAAQAFERAIGRKPNRADLLEIFQALGRVYQRAHRNEQALAVWSRLEKLFPDDPRVQEQIAASLAEESQPEQALPRYEALAQSTRDRFRQVQFRIDAAELKVRLNRAAEALADFEGLLGRLDPESWLYREVRRKIEEMFTRNDDQAGLAAYYEKWIKKTPDDVEAMARLGRALAAQGRLAEARGWYEKGVNLAPTRRDLRSALIEQLLIERKFPEAAAQYEAIAKLDPSNPDAIREWGRVLLRDTSQPEAERKKAASAVWRRLIDAHPGDPSTAVLVADLFRQAEMNDEAIALYRSAADANPNAPQYVEYLGEFYHRLKRGPEAVATWSRMTAPPNRNARTLGRLAEVLSGFGYKAEALAAASEAATLDREDFDLQLRLADLLHAGERLDDERTQLDFAARASTSPEQSEAVLDRQIKNDQVAGSLPARAEALRKELDAGVDVTSERWRRLARYLEADQKPSEALTAAQKATTLDPKSVLTLAMIARLDEGLGNLSGAADVLRKLAEVDRRARTEYLTGIARLEARLGRKDAALRAGRDLLAAAPGQLENHQFFAELCFQLGQVDEGLDALRRAVRLNEADPKALLSLAETLATQFRTEESIEMFWRAFDRSPDLEAKLSVVTRLTALYLQRNQFDRLIARLERQGREADRQREMAICLAQAYSASGDFGTARSELERLLSANPRDTKLLNQLSILAESEGDSATAAKFQKQLVDLAPGDEASARLAQLYLQAGDIAEAEALWARMATAGEPDSHRVLMAVDSLLGHGKRESVLGITENLLRKRPDSWEALYREGQALALLGKPAEAEKRFRALLAVKGNDDDLGAVARAKKKFGARPVDPNAPLTTNYYSPAKSFPLQDRLSRVSMIRGATGLDARYATGSVWSPDDLGQGRMAAVGWLYNLAMKVNRQDELIAEFRAACEKAPTDPRPHWDFYYLQLLRQEFPEIFDAAKGLSRAAATDPPAQFAFLNALPIRDKSAQNLVVNIGTTGPDPTPPLPAADVDLVLASYRSLRAQKPDWLHAAMLTATVDELRRAKRPEALEQFYREAVEAPTDADSAASVLRLAAERGDVDNVLKLHDRYERLVGNKPSASNNAYVYYGGYYTLSSTPADSIGRAMMARADARAHADVARMLDHYLAAARRPERITRRVRALATIAATSAANARVPRMQIWTSKFAKFETFTYPTPNPYYDQAGIQVLRNAFELYKRDDLVSDLRSHLKAGLAGGSDVDKAYIHLALCYLDWWADDKDEALRELTEAAAASKADPELLLSLAELRAQRNEPEEALRVADSFEPLDQKAMQRRELLALRLAVVTGDVARARRAAERLFGLRLDADTQVQLAAQMHQLGMHELAEAVLGRARRRAGGNAAALVALMLQYQRQGKADIAVQVAHQILRKNSSRATTGYSDETDEARTQAVQVLARSGQIKEMIGRVEDQIRRTPGALQLHQRLADYYKASGDKDKMKAEYDAIVRIRPDDARLRLQIAAELLRSGDSEAAVGHYKAAIRKEPTLFGSNFYEIQQAFQQANKFDDLIQLVEETDIRSVGPVYYVARMLQTILEDRTKRDRGLALFRKAWKAFPSQRNYFFMYIQDQELWRLPEMYEYIREATLPAESRASVAAWAGLDEQVASGSNGRSSSMGGLLVDAAARQGKLEALTVELERTEKRLPTWRGGKVLRGIVLARRGRVEEARAILGPLADPGQTDPAPALARQIVGQELEDVDALRPLSLSLYESAVADKENAETDYSSNPAQRLVELYRRAGRNDDARRELVKAARSGNRGGYDAALAAYYKVYDWSLIAASLLDVGFPAEAARMYDELLADKEMLELARDYFGNVESQVTELKQGLERSLKALDPEALARTLRTQVTSAGQGGSDAPALDLLLLVYPRELEHAGIASLLGSAIRSAAATPSTLEAVRADLAKLADRFPRDVPTRVALVLAAIASGDDRAIAPAVSGLVKLVEESPLEDLPASSRANSRQRAEAARQLGLAMIARECLGRPEWKESGRVLAARALEAARRQVDPSWSLALHRQFGQDALDRGDRVEAEASWSKLLALALGSSSATPGGPSGKPGAVPVATLERFEQAVRVAKLAARHGLTALSIRAAREPLRGGPPVVPLTVAANPNMRPARNAADASRDQAVARAVEERLADLEAAWEAGRVPAAEVFEVLRDVVLPEGRPLEVFAYPRPMGTGGLEHPRSVAALLVRSAIRAGRGDDLRRKAEERSQQPTAVVAGRSLLVQLDLARRDFQAANEGLETLASRLREDKLQSSAELASLAALPGLVHPESEKAARAVLDLAISTLVAAGAEPAAGKILIVLARRQFASGRAEEGRKLLRAYQEGLERMAAAGQSRYGGAGGRSRRLNSRELAVEFARGGLWDDAMEALGQYADAPMATYGDDGPGVALGAVARHLATLPPRERYEKLRAWTLPTEGRPTIRLLVGFAPSEAPPEVFGRPMAASGVVATWEWLIAAAREAGTLDELAGQTREAVGKKVDQAEALRDLIEIARGRSGEVEAPLRTLLAEWSKKIEEPGNSMFGMPPPRVLPWADYLRVRAALTDARLGDLGHRLASRLDARLVSRSSPRPVEQAAQAYLRRDVARSVAATEGRNGPGAGLDPGLALWSPSMTEAVAPGSLAPIPAGWVALDRHIHLRVASSAVSPEVGRTATYPHRPDTLVFDSPMTGRFEVSVEAMGSGVELGHGGMTMVPSAPDPGFRSMYAQAARTIANGQVRLSGAIQGLSRPTSMVAAGAYNRLSIRVEPGLVRYTLNGHRFFEDHDPSPASPWLILGASGPGEADFRNLTLTGTPEIPREVRLTHADRLEGWLSDFYAESRPDRPVGPDGRAAPGPLGSPAGPADEKDWSANDGQILGRRNPAPTGDGPAQSRLSYHRALRPGESIAYEFFHEPDAVMVHPALGRVAFLIEPAGVRLHWMTDGPDLDWHGLEPGNVADEPSSRRGPSPLPLRSGEWNRIKLALVGRTVELELNGVKVFERDVEPTSSRAFSFYHDKDRTAAKVRDVVLRGDWPTSLPAAAAADLAILRDDPGPADRRARHRLIGDAVIGLDAGRWLVEATSVPPETRSELLAAWVLPGDARPGFRLAGHFAPTDRDPSNLIGGNPPTTARTHAGGMLNAPALELVRAARLAGRLDALAGRVEQATASTDLDRRGKLAILALIRAEQGRDAEAEAALKALRPLLEQVPPDAPDTDRWPELIAMAGVAGRPALGASARSIGDYLVGEQLGKEHGKAVGETWKLHALQVAALAGRTDVARSFFAADPGLASWARVTHGAARTRGTGAPLPLWDVRDNTLTHFRGHHHDFVYLRTPVRGDFELTGETLGGRPIQLAYGGLAIGLTGDGKEVIISTVGQPPRRAALDTPLVVGDGPHRVRLSVRGGTLTAFLDDRKLHEQGLPAVPDPWLALYQPAADLGSIRGLKLEGQPAVPDRLDLAAGPGLDGWRADYYDETLTGLDPAWQWRGGEIVGRAIKNAAGSKQESLLQYHRPILEDGEVAYDFYFEPGRVAVHPALDRLAFLIEPGGVKVHRLTDAQNDRTGLDPGNASEEPSHRKGPAILPIKAGDWNRLALAVAGNVLTIRINDVLVYEGRIDPFNQRDFGLFHFADESEARVRNLSYQGEWPRVLPPDLGFGR